MKQAKTQAEAIELLVTSIEPYVKNFDSNSWRWETYISEEVDAIYKKYISVINGVYKKYSGKQALPGMKK